MKNQKKWKTANIIGAVIMAGMILMAMPLGVAHSLEDLRDDAEWQYYGDRTGFSIYESVEKRQEAAHNLLTVANKYTGAHTELIPYVNELEYQVQASENAYDETFYTEGAANMAMGAAAEELAGALEKIDLEEKDQKYPAQLMAQMQSEQDKIERSSYNDAARAFNDRLTVFPVNMLWRLTGVQPLIPFDEHGEYVIEETMVEEAAPEYFAGEAVAE